MANLNRPNVKDRTLEQFKGRMSGGGVRPNLFECELNFPTDSLPIEINENDLSDKTRFLVKAANLPASNLGVIDVPFRGRNLKMAGDRTFDPWTITVINDTDFSIRTAFERWMNLMNKHEDAAGIIDPALYQKDMFVKQFGRGRVEDGSIPNTKVAIPVLKAYQFYGTFPSAISAIDLSYDSSDTIEEFTVDLQVQWWDALDSAGKSQLGTGV
jgi:hypothetical protein